MGLFSKSPSVVETFNSIPPLAGFFTTPAEIAAAVFPDFDFTEFPVTQEEALAVPAVSRALALYSSIASRLPLEGPAWLSQGNEALTPALRIAQTVQDLILHGASVWGVARDGETITYAERIHPSRWGVTNDGHVKVDNKKVPDQSVIFFPSLMPVGLLTAARHSIRQYTSICRTITNRTAVPEPAVLIEQTSDFIGTPEEIDATIENLQEVLANRRGGILYVPQGIAIRAFGASDSANAMMIEARNALRTDLANFLNITAAILDGTQSGASDVYTNALQSKNELLEFSIKTFTEPIADRLSQPDAAGTKVTFDYSSFDTPADSAGNVGAPRATNPAPAEVTNA